MKTRLIVLALFTWTAFTLLADATAKKDPNNPNVVYLKNEVLTLGIDLERGAHGITCLYRGFEDADIVFDYKSENGGLFKDLWLIQGWPGEFDKRTYKAEILKDGPDEAVLKTWTVSTGEYQSKKQEDIANIRIVKIFRLRKGERVVRVDYEFTNQGDKGKRIAFWSQQAFNFKRQTYANIYWRPTRHGVDSTGVNGVPIGFGSVTSKQYWQTANVTAGWNGAVHPRLKQGVMFLMDYNDVQQVYDNWGADTLEWMYDDIAIPAGKTWKTSQQMIVAEGFGGFTYADRDLLAFTESVVVPAGLSITHTFAAVTGKLKDVTIRTEAREIRGAWKASGEEVKLEKLGAAPMTRTVTLTGIGAMPCVIQTTVSGKRGDGTAMEVVYADFRDGKTDRNIDLVTLGPLYEFPVPEKKKQYLKPDTIALKHAGPPRILFVRGLWAEFYGIDEAVKRLGDVTLVDGWMKKSALGETLGNFPASYEDLLGYDVIILGNVSGPMLGMVGQEMLADFMKAGGGVLMLGGDRTYGQTAFNNANFYACLPITIEKSPDGDYGRLKSPATFAQKTKHAVTDGWASTVNDIALHSHRLKPRGNAVTAVELKDGTPALVLSKDGPRMACVGVLPFGEAPAGKTLFYETVGWQTLMANTLKWLMKKIK